MPDLMEKRRSGWVLLAVCALIASLLAVGVNPATAVEEKADHLASASACEGEAETDRMFTDVPEGHTFRDAINCLAYHGITVGTGDGTTFSPSRDVTRWQMALFIARAMKAAGVDLGAVVDAGFTDIGDAPAVSRDAINQLAANGVIPEADTYRPNDPMTRADMAIFLVGFLDKAAPNVTITEDGVIMLGTGSAAAEADDHFADVRALSSPSVDRAAAALWELGVTRGTNKAAAVVDPTRTPLDVKYDPQRTVTRGAMAAFITRALAHTSLAPATTTVDPPEADPPEARAARPGSGGSGGSGRSPTTPTTAPPDPTTPATVARTAVTVSFGALLYTATEGGAAANVRVELSAAAERTVTVPLTVTRSGGATTADYTLPAPPTQVTFDVGQRSQTFTVTAINDSIDDDGESLTIGFGTLPVGMTATSPTSIEVALVDNDDPLGRVTMRLPAGCVLRDLITGNEMPYASYYSGCASLHIPGRNAHYYRLVVRQEGAVTLAVSARTASHLLIRSASGEVIARYDEPGEIQFYQLSLTRTLEAGTYVIEVAAQWHHYSDHGRGHTLRYSGSTIARPGAYKLAGLSITDVNLAHFAAGTTEYSRNIAADVRTVTVTPTATLDDAEVTVMPPDANASLAGRQVDLEADGVTEVTVAVNSPMIVDAETMYRVVLTQLAGTTAPLSDDPGLVSLSFEGIDIGDFSSDKTGYTYPLGFYERLNGTTVTMSVTPAGGATWTANRSDEDEDVDGHQLSIDGDDVILVTVTSQDNANTRVYRVAPEAPVTRAAWLPAGCVLRDLITGNEMPYASYYSGCASLHIPRRNAHYYRLVVRPEGAVTLAVSASTASHLLIRSASGEVIARYDEPGEIEFYQLSLTRTLEAGTYVIEVAAQWDHFSDHGRGHTLRYSGSTIARPGA